VSSFCVALFLSGAVTVLFGLSRKEGAQGLVLGILGNALVLTTMALLAARGDRQRLRLRKPPLLATILAMVGMLGLAKALDDAIALLGLYDLGILKFFHDTLEAIGPSGRWMVLPATGIAAPIGEELYFRGFVLGRLEGPLGAWPAILISAFLFGFLHLDPVQSSAAFVMGIFLGFAVVRSGSLWTSLLAHLANNSIATFAAGGPDDEGRWLTLGLGLLLAAIGVVGLALKKRAPEPPPSWAS
jgi:membrane protease YdiL (CAAX protease family)